MEPAIYVSCRLSLDDGNDLDAIAKTGKYLNRSDAMRTAIRSFIEREKRIV